MRGKLVTMEPRADLHVHTTASDGALAPTEIVRAAADAGLAAVAITDHDVTDGIDEALAAGKQMGIDVVPGIEISAVLGKNVEVHVLGYYLDCTDPELCEKLRMLRDSRFERGRRMVELLNAIGVPVKFERVMEIAQGGAVGRPHVARALLEIGAASSIDAAFGRYLVEGCPAFVPRFKISPSEAVKLIRHAGGAPCCAHVAKLNRDDLLIDLMAEGLEAIEVYHPDHGSAGTRYYERFAAKHGLIATGGSDAHCIEGGKTTSVGSVSVPYEVVKQLKAVSGTFAH